MLMESNATAALLLSLVVPTAIYLWTTHNIQVALRIHHESKWVALGRPQIGTASLTATGRFLRFCWSKEQRLLRDSRISRQILMWRISAVWACAGYLLLLGILISEDVARR